jgi:hypothetical protein
MNDMIITNAKYNIDFLSNKNCSISCIANGEHVSVPIAVGNRHYDEIKRQVDAGTLTIAAAD